MGHTYNKKASIVYLKFKFSCVLYLCLEYFMGHITYLTLKNYPLFTRNLNLTGSPVSWQGYHIDTYIHKGNRALSATTPPSRAENRPQEKSQLLQLPCQDLHNLPHSLLALFLFFPQHSHSTRAWTALFLTPEHVQSILPSSHRDIDL